MTQGYVRDVRKDRLTEKNTSDNKNQHLPADRSDTDVLIRHFNGPVWSRRNDTMSAFYSPSNLLHEGYISLLMMSFPFSSLLSLKKLVQIRPNSPRSDRKMGLSGGIPHIMRCIFKTFLCILVHHETLYQKERLTNYVTSRKK